MLRSIRDIIGYQVKAADGMIGRVTDCLIEDESWRLRHVVVDTGNHFKIDFRYLEKDEDFAARRREVLIEPQNLKELGVGWVGRKLSLDLTKDKVEHSPGLATDAPISDQFEWEYTKYYRHIPYGERPRVGESSPYQPPVSAYPHNPEELEAHKKRIRKIREVHLHSARELLNYHVEAADGSVGAVLDFVVHAGDWEIRQLAVQMGGLLRRKNVLVRSSAISEINWSDEAIWLDMLSDEVVASPTYRVHAPVNRDRGNHYFDYYGKPVRSKKPTGKH